MSEPVITVQTNDTGRPSISDEQYQLWLSELKPYLELSSSLYGACIKAGLESHYRSIARKYEQNDWFCQKVDAYKASFGESINEGLARETLRIVEKTRKGELLTRPEIDVLKHMSEKHRAAQPFFVSRQEVTSTIVEPNKISDLLDDLEAKNQRERDKYAEVGEQARKAAEAMRQNTKSFNEKESNQKTPV